MTDRRLTIVICTHNRAQLLARTLDALCALAPAKRLGMNVLVIANACSDGTREMVQGFQKRLGQDRLRFVEEPTPGKSFALNRALPLIEGDATAFVDDDQCPAPDFLAEIEKALDAYPDTQMFCGRLIPEWTGAEPKWIHDVGPYRIYPPPIPADDAGPAPLQIGPDGWIPAGGNLIVRTEVFPLVGGFNTKLGPTGHNLGGGEDQEFILRCLRAGMKLQYWPGILQFHYVDPERLTVRYLIRKSYERTRAAVLLSASGDVVPLYLWRKLATYAAAAITSLDAARTRFYLIRLAAALGELSATREAAHRARAARRAEEGWIAWGYGVALLLLSSLLAMRYGSSVVGPAAFVAAALNVKSLRDFTRTGPQLKEEILRSYRWYALHAILRLTAWSFVLCLLMAGAGLILLEGITGTFGFAPGTASRSLAALAGIAAISGLQFCRHLLHIPGSIAASSNYRLSRFYPLWRTLSPGRLKATTTMLAAALAGGALLAVFNALAGNDPRSAALLAAVLGLYAAVARSMGDTPEPAPAPVPRGKDRPLNVLMIGVDTLRADRLGIEGHPRALTPTLDALASRGVYLGQCYIPCGRTAPSLASLLTGTWPHTHGIRDNFASPSEARIGLPSLAHVFGDAGYQTVAISDWAGADLGKYPFGFERQRLPTDQWNIKYLIRQGPKDLRLFLSLFTHNEFGRRFLPELYYLASVPMTDELGRATRQSISRCAASDKPFFINAFFSTTHVPFSSEYPYYTMYSDREYSGPSKFVMGLMNDPFEIIKQQRHTAADFDLTQVHALYDGCVRRFDDEVKGIVDHLKACGILEETLIVIFSDHGIEFFERDSWGQGNSVVVDGSSRIPVLLIDPRRKNARRIDDVTRSIDIAPTVLDLAGLPVPPTMEGISLRDRIDGQIDRLDLMAFEETGIWFTRIPGLPAAHLHYPDLPELLTVPNKSAGALTIKPEYYDLIIRAKDRAVRSTRWKLVYMPMQSGEARLALFDLASDPECRRDVLAEQPQVAAELWKALRDWMRDSERCDVSDATSPARCAAAVPAAAALQPHG